MSQDLLYNELVPFLADKAIKAAASNDFTEAEKICYTLWNEKRRLTMLNNSNDLQVLQGGLKTIEEAGGPAQETLVRMSKFFPEALIAA